MHEDGSARVVLRPLFDLANNDTGCDGESMPIKLRESERRARGEGV